MVGYTPKGSMRPLLVAGHGIRLANAQKELMQVLDKGIPVVTTFNGFDLVPSDHPCFVGRIGTVGTYGGNYALQHCDLLICVGTRNNVRQVSYRPETFAPQALKMVVDVNQAELDKFRDKTVKICEDAKKFLRTFEIWKILDIDQVWLSALKGYPKKEYISAPYKFIHELTSALSDDAVVVCGNGTACVCMFQAGIVKKGQRIFWNSGCAAMGYDLPAAIGACFANNKKEVICITGDGSIQMNIQELQTIKHHKLPIKIFVLNNKGYHSIKMTQDNYFKSDYIGCNKKDVSFPSFERIAFAYDMPYFQDIKTTLKCKEACICEVDIGNDYKIEPKWTGGFV